VANIDSRNFKLYILKGSTKEGNGDDVQMFSLVPCEVGEDRCDFVRAREVSPIGISFLTICGLKPLGGKPLPDDSGDRRL
jgi:hypothetical protein